MTKYELKKLFSPITIGIIIIMLPIILHYGYFDEYDFTKNAIKNNTMDGGRAELNILPKLIKENGNKVDDNLEKILIREKDNRLKYLEEKFQKIPTENRGGYKSAEEYINASNSFEKSEDYIPIIESKITSDRWYYSYDELISNFNVMKDSHDNIIKNNTTFDGISKEDYLDLTSDKEYNTIISHSIVRNTNQAFFSIIFTVGILITILIIPYLLMDNKNKTLESIYTMKIGRKFFNRKFKITIMTTLILWIVVTLLHLYMMHNLFDFTLFFDSRITSFFTGIMVNSKITYLGYIIILLLFSFVTVLFFNFVIYLIGTKIMKSTTSALTSILIIFSIFFIVIISKFNPFTNNIDVFPYYFKEMIIVFSVLLLISITIYFINYRKNLKRDIL